jgi:hypothetical protein
VGPVLYSPSHFLSTELALSPHQDQDLHVYIFPEHLTSNNIALKNEEIWGSNPYSTESDAVCILQHSGLYDVLTSIPPDGLVALKLVLRIHPGVSDLQGTERHGIRSKNGSSTNSVCLSALQFHILRESTETIEQFRKTPLYGPPRPDRPPLVKFVLSSSSHPSHTSTSAVSSTIPPSSSSTSSTPVNVVNPKRNPRRAKRYLAEEIDNRVSIDVLPDTILQFNLSNELAFQYNLNLICDRGIEPSQWTSHRLRNAVLMLETLCDRFELSWEQEAHPHTATNAQFDTYRFTLVNSPFTKTRTWHASKQVPLESPGHSKPLHSGLDWSQLVWGPSTLTILGKVYNIRRIFWIARTVSSSSSSSSSAQTTNDTNNTTSNTTTNTNAQTQTAGAGAAAGYSSSMASTDSSSSMDISTPFGQKSSSNGM